MMLSWYWHTNRWLLSQLCGGQLPVQVQALVLRLRPGKRLVADQEPAGADPAVPVGHLPLAAGGLPVGALGLVA